MLEFCNPGIYHHFFSPSLLQLENSNLFFSTLMTCLSQTLPQSEYYLFQISIQCEVPLCVTLHLLLHMEICFKMNQRKRQSECVLFSTFYILSENSREIPHKCCLSFLPGISTFYRENCLQSLQPVDMCQARSLPLQRFTKVQT